MDAGAVGEGVGPDDGLVGLHRHVAELADQGAGAMNFAVADVGVHPEQVGAGLQDHRHLFQRAVAGPLADAVDGALDLAGPICTAPMELATERPRSSWQCTEMMA